jgi:hypothetical protein
VLTYCHGCVPLTIPNLMRIECERSVISVTRDFVDLRFIHRVMQFDGQSTGESTFFVYFSRVAPRNRSSRRMRIDIVGRPIRFSAPTDSAPVQYPRGDRQLPRARNPCDLSEAYARLVDTAPALISALQMNCPVCSNGFTPGATVAFAAGSVSTQLPSAPLPLLIQAIDHR